MGFVTSKENYRFKISLSLLPMQKTAIEMVLTDN